MNKTSGYETKPVIVTNQDVVNSPEFTFCECRYIFNVNDGETLISLCRLVTSHWGQIRDLWDSQFFTIVYIVIGLSLHIHSFIHLR